MAQTSKEKAQKDHYRRLFPELAEDDPSCHVPESDPRSRYAAAVFFSHSVEVVHGSLGPLGHLLRPVMPEQKQSDRLGESADRYAHSLKKTFEQAVLDLTALVSAQTSRPFTAIVNGETVSFETVEGKFDALVAEWRRLREQGSSTAPLINDAYGQIVAMGWRAVPFLL